MKAVRSWVSIILFSLMLLSFLKVDGQIKEQLTTELATSLVAPTELDDSSVVSGSGRAEPNFITVEMADNMAELGDPPPRLTNPPHAPFLVPEATDDIVPLQNVPETTPVLAPEDQPIISAPGDYEIFRNVDIRNTASLPSTSSTNEPSIDARNDTMFLSGNWYAAVSTDRGQFWQYMSPFSSFPASNGGFCCDQVVLYDEANDLLFWLLQYLRDANGNRLRLAVIAGSDLNPGMNASDWTYYDFTPASFGITGDRWLDYPEMKLSNNHLFITSNVFSFAGSGTNNVVWRIPLDDLSAGGSIGFQYFQPCASSCTTTPVNGAGATMYLARHVDTNTLKIYSWAESSGTIFNRDRDIATWSSPSTYLCSSPDGNNACGFADGRISDGWVSGNSLGFLWTAGQGSGFPYPYVNMARFNISNSYSLLDQPRIWSSGVAWIYGSMAVNDRGHIAGAATIAGPTWYPSAVVYIDDDYNGNPASTGWENLVARTGTDGPSRNRWGDYLTTRAHEQYGNSWISAVFTLQGGDGNGNARPRLVWHGRERDRPAAIDSPGNDDFANAWTLISTSAQNVVQATTAIDDPSTPCGSTAFPWQSNSVWYRYTAPNSGQYIISTDGSSYDTVLAVWTGSRGSLTNRACDDDSGVGTNSLLTMTMSSGTTYYIEVADFNAPNGGNLSLRIARLPNAISLINPPNNSFTGDDTPTWQWSADAFATSYQLQVDDVSSFASPEINITTSNTQYVSPLNLNPSPYYWRVRGRNSNGDWGPWSPTWQVTILYQLNLPIAAR